MLTFPFREIKISPKKREKEVLSLHGLHSVESAFWGDRREAEGTRAIYREEANPE